MKLSVKLTADELKNVTESIVAKSVELGWLYNIEDPDLDEILQIVDAALDSMGIEILENDDEAEEADDWYEDDTEEEEDDPIEEMVFIKEGKRTISQANATMLLNMVANCVLQDERVPDDRKWETIQGVFLAFAKEHELECVEMDGE